MVFQVSPRLLEWLAPALYGFSLFLLVLVLLVGTGAGTAQSSKSWLSIGGHQIGQPSELAKVATVLMLARYLSGRREPPRSLRDLLVPGHHRRASRSSSCSSSPTSAAPSCSSGSLFAMLFWAGVRPRLLFLLASPGAEPAAGVQRLDLGRLDGALHGAARSSGGPYISDALVVWFLNVAMGADRPAALEPAGARTSRTGCSPSSIPKWIRGRRATTRSSRGWRSARAAGSAPDTPTGPQKRLAFLPEQHTDFIFPIVGEELGFVGVVVALALFLALFLTLLRIARRATDPFSSLVVFGILGLLFTHVFENVGMTVNLMPITGIPLPFFSYGGSFFVICCLCLGLAFRVAYDSRQSGYPDI